MDRRNVLSTSAAAGRGRARRLCDRRHRRVDARRAAPCSQSPSRCCRSSAATRCSRCAASTASAATTRRTRARWVPTRPASRRSSSRSRATRSSTSPPGTIADHPYPTLTKNYHYEVELVAALDKGGQNIPSEQALDLVYGYAVGLDMTRRDLQRAMGDEKKPWEIGKSFDRSAPIGPMHRVAQIGHFTKGAIWLKVNGQIKQNADLNQMIWTVAEQISQAVAGVRADARRHHLLGHAGERRPGGAGRRDGGLDRRPAGARRARDGTAC